MNEIRLNQTLVLHWDISVISTAWRACFSWLVNLPPAKALPPRNQGFLAGLFLKGNQLAKPSPSYPPNISLKVNPAKNPSQRCQKGERRDPEFTESNGCFRKEVGKIPPNHPF